ncbi:alpha/beta hydrolase fold domain-containing protein [Marinoscillum luteum]|uniref:Alpha/beta hydrolase fold domain-containing protein n=1 Tax=Marinoscillum luteum TaxID=861051 RepID=A0ABW7N2D2_9BACT
MIAGWVVVGQVPRDTSYTVANTVAKVLRHYPNLDVQGVEPNDPESVTSTFDVAYKDLGYRSLVANLFIPKEKRVSAAILMIHGGGWRAGSPGLMTPMAERLAESGYLVMVPEYRLSMEALYPAAIGDLKDALQWMRDRSRTMGMHTNRMVVLGCSAGGQLAALLGTTTDVQAIVDIDGVLAFKHPDSQEGSMAAQWLGGTYEEVPELWQEASALTHVSASTPPTLFLASKYPRFLDGRQEYMQVLEEVGTYTAVRVFEDAPHSFWLLSPWFEATVVEVIKFLNDTILEQDN